MLALNLGYAHSARGRPHEARPWFERSLALAQRVGYRGGIAKSLGNLGIVHIGLSHYRMAIETLEADLTMEHELGNPVGEALALAALAHVEVGLGRMDPAREHGLPESVVHDEALLAALGGANTQEAQALFERHAKRLTLTARMGSEFQLWKATRDPAYLQRAHDALALLVENAPDDAREPMLRKEHLLVEARIEGPNGGNLAISYPIPDPEAMETVGVWVGITTHLEQPEAWTLFGNMVRQDANGQRFLDVIPPEHFFRN
ncbi:MAG: tetratricopeptide repeat protein [Planctomycetota bacterium]